MAGLIVTFGLHLDGQRAVKPADRLGEIVVGPLGLLNILETHLGLLGGQPSRAERIVQYRECLAKMDDASRFYHASFAMDPLGTAATLLEWRDLWHLHGWDGGFGHGAASRLADLAAVEDLVDKHLAPSLGERLVRVRQELDARTPPIRSVRLVDSPEALPKRWRDVLEKLPATAVTAEDAAGEGFLGKLQAALRQAAAGEKTCKPAWQDDGSVRVVRGETRFLAGAWLAREMEESSSSLLVSTVENARLDASLTNAGRPRHGLREPSAFRPTLQVLPLILELLWEPLNFYGLIQFLTHSVSPIPGFARRQLAAKVADRPGIGGQSWNDVLAEIDNHYGDSAASVREKIRQWVEHPRYRTDEGAPVPVVLERVQALADFFRLRLGDENPARRIAYNAGHAQCRACVESLKALVAQGVESIRPRQLQKLVMQATANGSDNPLLAAEVGAQLAITYPGAAVEAADRVVWWQLTMPTLPSPYPWSAAELGALREAGAELPAGERLFAQAAEEWLRPVLAARRQLVLVLPPAGDEVHPLWQMIEAVVDKPRVESLERFLSEQSPTGEAVPHKALPSPRRWWQLPDDVRVPLRDKESFSSLELLLFNPYHWLLKYPAALRPSRIVTLGGDFRLMGNLAHDLGERYFQCADALQMSDAQFQAWFDPAFEQLMTEEGAVLRMPGRGADLEGFRHKLRQAMLVLRQQIARAGIVAVAPEMALHGHFAGGELSGYADLVMQKKSGAHAIVDMKWSGAKKYPDKLRQNRHLQLAIYAELLRQKEGAWPAVAYYILDRSRFFAPDNTTFPDAEAVASKSGENTSRLWLRFMETWKWRRAQIEAGAFEVAIESIETTDESVPPEEALEMEYLSENYNDYRSLAGWER